MKCTRSEHTELVGGLNVPFAVYSYAFILNSKQIAGPQEAYALYMDDWNRFLYSAIIHLNFHHADVCIESPRRNPWN